jgi:hypothetical protein
MGSSHSAANFGFDLIMLIRAENSDSERKDVFANTSTTSKGAHPLQYPHV